MSSVTKLSYLYIFGTILFTVYGQIILKARVAGMGAFPKSGSDKLDFLLHALLDPWIISGLVAAFLASVCWIAAMTKFQLSYAYPFMSLSFVLVFFLSAWLFNEPVTVQKVVGLLLIMSGIFVTSRSI